MAISPNASLTEITMSSTEGNVYLCRWSKRENKFKITLKADPMISVASEDFHVAEELMWELLCGKFGDGEAVLEYDKPLPKSQFRETFGKPEILSISGNDGVGRVMGSPVLFDGGMCETCQNPLGNRTNESVEFDYLPASDGAVVSKVGPIFSEQFLSLLSNEERASLSLLPVLGPAKSRKQFYEAVGKPIADFVGVPNFPGLLSRRCKACGRFGFTYLYKNKLFQFIALGDLPKPVPGVFVIGSATDPHLCMTRDRYQLIIGKIGTKNVVSGPIWVVADSNFVRHPEDAPYPEEFYWRSRMIEIPANSPNRHLIPREIR